MRIRREVEYINEGEGNKDSERRSEEGRVSILC